MLSDGYKANNMVYDVSGTAPTQRAEAHGNGTLIEDNMSIKWPTNNKIGFIEAEEGDAVITDRPTKARGTVQKGFTPTIVCTQGGGCGTVTKEEEELRIRYLTPRECFRLMGQPDDAIDRIQEAIPSKSVQYRLAGNSIVVPVLTEIFKGIYIDKTFEIADERQSTLSDWM